jgi:hypothetical protein
MRDINRAERVLSLFVSTESAAGIVGDLIEERGQRGRVWFWRQVVGTAFAICRGAWFASPGKVLLLVLLGLALDVGLSFSNRYVLNLHSAYTIYILLLYSYSGILIIGALLVAASPRLGMAACVLLAVVSNLLPLSDMLYAISTHAQPLWAWRFVILDCLLSPLFLCLGGAIVRRRWTLRERMPPCKHCG